VNRSTILRCCAALVGLAPLSGCVAVPLVAAAGMIAKGQRSRAEVMAALPAANAAALAALPDEAPAAARASMQLTVLTELPPPSGGIAVAGPWSEFAAYALARARVLNEGGSADSALLAPGAGLAFETRVQPCDAREPAVIVDLDPGDALFAPSATGPAAPAAAAAIGELRAAGIVVLWVSQVNANEVPGVADALKVSGLDPSGRDPILLVRHAEERKQVLREEAGRAVCVVAIAGDERGDFDELFEYLRDPADGAYFDTLLGSGWFLVPGPLAAAP
jgi:hypothetical protein